MLPMRTATIYTALLSLFVWALPAGAEQQMYSVYWNLNGVVPLQAGTAPISRNYVLFNFSDIGQQSDVRAHRLTAAYALDPRVTLSFTGLFTQRPNGVLGVFGQTPPGSLNRTLTRLQLDTILRF